MTTPTKYDIQPAKRRRTKKNNPLHEDDVDALEAVTVDRVIVQTKKGPVERNIFVPIPKETITMNVEDNQPPYIPEMDINPVENNDNYETQETAGVMPNRNVSFSTHSLIFIYKINEKKDDIPSEIRQSN